MRSVIRSIARQGIRAVRRGNGQQALAFAKSLDTISAYGGISADARRAEKLAAIVRRAAIELTVAPMRTVELPDLPTLRIGDNPARNDARGWRKGTL